MLNNHRSRHGSVVMLFDTYPRGTVFKLQYQQHPWNDPG